MLESVAEVIVGPQRLPPTAPHDDPNDPSNDNRAWVAPLR